MHPRTEKAILKVQKKAILACKLPTLYFRRIRGDMIETFKIVTGIYKALCLWLVHHMQQEEVTTSDYRKLGQNIMIYVNTISLTELLICGILCLVMSSLQNL